MRLTRPHQGYLLWLLLSIPVLVLAKAGPEASPKAKPQNEEYSNGVNYDNYNPEYVDENYGNCNSFLTFLIPRV